MGIVKTAVSKFRTTILVMIFLIIMGMFGRAAMPIASNPNIQFPFVNISVFLEGASPEDMARIVAKPLENRFLRLEGQEQVRSTNTQSFTNLTIQYDVDYDMDKIEITKVTKYKKKGDSVELLKYGELLIDFIENKDERMMDIFYKMCEPRII